MNKKASAAGSLISTTDFHEVMNIKCEMDSPTIKSDRRLLNLRDPNESDRTTMIQDTVEKAVSMESKHTVECLLAQVRQLSPIERLLLYLKLPNGRSSADPLRQNLNPLGSRLEINHTITWIKTHLQEDPEVSLPKQDVYEQYLDFCQGNAVKPLSTADFGKVMKQVYPNVRPRRLGTRGHSRYCYAGLRKRMRLAPPLLPDLGPNEKAALEDTNGGKAGSPERTLLAAVSVLVREWAGKTLGHRFTSLQDLACHLVQSMSVNVQSTAALTVLSALNPPIPRSSGPSRPTSSAASLGSEGRPPSSCSAGPSRPASETPRSSIERDHKRKMQDDVERARLKTTDTKMRSKRTKQRSSSSPLDANPPPSGGRRSVTSKVASPLTNPNCDNLTTGQPFSGVPYANTKNGQADVQNNNTLLSNGSALDVRSGLHPLYNDTLGSEAGVNASIGADYMGQRPDAGLDGKLPIPRLPKPNNKQAMQNYMNAPFAPPYMAGTGQQQQIQNQSPVPAQKQKYKPIKPKPNMNETAGLKSEDDPMKQPSIVSDENGALKGVASSQKAGNEAIIGCLEKDALDDYLHGGSNSQEQEEELMQYFPQQTAVQQPMQVDSANSLDKISQLRRLLERNMNQDLSGKVPQYQNGLSAAASLSLMSQRSQQKQALIPPALLTCQHNSARRVSFEIPCDPDSAASSIPPSPNTKQRFSFTPISPRPYSPTKSSSANASPFVSPRNTPIPRRMSTQPTTTFMQSTASTMYPGKSMHKANLPRTMMRSMSVNSETCGLSPFQAVHHRPFVSSMKATDHMNVDVKPDVNSLQDLGNPNDCHGNVYPPAWNPTSQSHTGALPPLQVPRSQYQVSMSAPQSPVVHYSKSVKKNVFNFRKESRAHSFDMESSNHLPSVDFKNQPDLPSCHSGSQPHSITDKYSDEMGELFPEEDLMMPAQLSSVQGMSTFRSQSVPLRRMVNSAAVSPMPNTALPSPHYGPPQNQPCYFNFNQYTPGSSVAPTPVPSEVADFGIDNEGIHPSPVPAPGSLQDLHDGLTSDSINPDILNEMFSMFDEGKADGQQASQDFPQTPEQYKPDPETTLRGDPLFSSFRLQAVGSECGPGSCSEDQLSLSAAQSTITTSADPILNELNSMANTGNTQPDMDSLMEDAPSSFMTDDLESEISQLTREVGNSNS